MSGFDTSELLFLQWRRELYAAHAAGRADEFMRDMLEMPKRMRRAGRRGRLLILWLELKDLLHLGRED
jgi:hypothetical protein